MAGDRRKSMFLDSMSRWPAGVSVVTAPEGENFRAATISSFTSLSADPPQVMVAMKGGSRVLELAKNSGVFFVSVLGEEQESVSNEYARVDSDPLPGPFANDACASFTCTVQEVLNPAHGTHCILVGRVDTCTPDPGKRPLLYWNRAYRRVN